MCAQELLAVFWNGRTGEFFFSSKSNQDAPSGFVATSFSLPHATNRGLIRTAKGVIEYYYPNAKKQILNPDPDYAV